MTLSLAKRHLQVFFRDRGAVFFSLLSPLILFLLYFLFLGNTTMVNLENAAAGVSKEKLSLFLDSWVYAGIVMTAAVTTGLAALGVFVSDRESGRFSDFAVSPIPRWKVVLSYLLSTMTVSLIMTTIVYIVAQAHLSIQSGSLPALSEVAQVVGCYALIAFSLGAVSSLVVTFLKSDAAFSAVSIIVGTGIGFLAGIYVPIGVLSSGVASTLNALPFAQSAYLMRDAMASRPLVEVGVGQPEELVGAISETYGLELAIGDTSLSVAMVVAILLAIGLVALVLAVVQISRKLE